MSFTWNALTERFSIAKKVSEHEQGEELALIGASTDSWKMKSEPLKSKHRSRFDEHVFVGAGVGGGLSCTKKLGVP